MCALWAAKPISTRRHLTPSAPSARSKSASALQIAGHHARIRRIEDADGQPALPRHQPRSHLCLRQRNREHAATLRNLRNQPAAQRYQTRTVFEDTAPRTQLPPRSRLRCARSLHPVAPRDCATPQPARSPSQTAPAAPRRPDRAAAPPRRRPRPARRAQTSRYAATAQRRKPRSHPRTPRTPQAAHGPSQATGCRAPGTRTPPRRAAVPSPSTPPDGPAPAPAHRARPAPARYRRHGSQHAHRSASG